MKTTNTTSDAAPTSAAEHAPCNLDELAEAHAALFRALGELAACLDSTRLNGVDDLVHQGVVSAIAEIANARTCMQSAVRVICPELDGAKKAGDTALARAMPGGAS